MFSKQLFGQRLKEIRSKNGETQPELGAFLGIGKSRISEIENGITSTKVENIVMICEHYRISADYLLGLSDDPEPNGVTRK